MSQLRVLICEDSGLTTLRLRASLLQLGHEVVGTAADGEEAVVAALRLQPDLILMDVQMPRKDGLAALREIMSRSPMAVLIMTGYQDSEVVSASFQAGAAGFLSKPFSDDLLSAELGVAVQRFLGSRAVSPWVRKPSLFPDSDASAENQEAEPPRVPDVGRKGGGWGVRLLKEALAPECLEELRYRARLTRDWSRATRELARRTRAQSQAACATCRGLVNSGCRK